MLKWSPDKATYESLLRGHRPVCGGDGATDSVIRRFVAQRRVQLEQQKQALSQEHERQQAVADEKGRVLKQRLQRLKTIIRCHQTSRRRDGDEYNQQMQCIANQAQFHALHDERARLRTLNRSRGELGRYLARTEHDIADNGLAPVLQKIMLLIGKWTALALCLSRSWRVISIRTIHSDTPKVVVNVGNHLSMFRGVYERDDSPGGVAFVDAIGAVFPAYKKCRTQAADVDAVLARTEDGRWQASAPGAILRTLMPQTLVMGFRWQRFTAVAQPYEVLRGAKLDQALRERGLPLQHRFGRSVASKRLRLQEHDMKHDTMISGQWLHDSIRVRSHHTQEIMKREAEQEIEKAIHRLTRMQRQLAQTVQHCQDMQREEQLQLQRRRVAEQHRQRLEQELFQIQMDIKRKMQQKKMLCSQ